MATCPALHGSYCSSCCDLFYPAREACPRCGQHLEACDFCGKGDVYSYAVMHDQNGAAANVGAKPPQIVALVHLAEGAYVTAQLVGIAPETVFIGLPVEATDGEGRLGFRLRRNLVE